LIVLALILGVSYAYWSMTNDASVRRQTERYLHDLTGGKVHVEEAKFSLFGGIELRGVSIRIPGDDSPEPFLYARMIVLHHRPWGLLTGSLEPTEILCIEPVVTLERNEQQENYSAEKLLEGDSERGGAVAYGGELPPIRIRQSRIIVVRSGGALREVVEERSLNLVGLPDGPNEYLFAVEERQAAMKGQFRVNISTGKVTPVSTTVVIEGVGQVLPPRYRQWCERYHLKGEIRLGAVPATQPAGHETLEAQLTNVSLTLPPEEGNLQVEGVRGTLIFDEQGVTIRSLQGVLPRMGGAKLSIEGRYDGYSPESPFDVRLAATEMEIPAPSESENEPAWMRSVWAEYQPKGRMNISARVRRGLDGGVDVAGEAQPAGMTLFYKYFPYRMEDVRGTIAFTSRKVEIRGLTARHGGGRIRLAGGVDPSDRHRYDIAVQADGVELDSQMRTAVQAVVPGIWDVFGPGGSVSTNLRIRSDGRDDYDHFTLNLQMGGKMSIRYRDFPYPVENLLGEAIITNDSVKVENVQGSHGPAQFVIHGTMGIAESPWNLDLTIDARQVPLDDTLVNASPEVARKILAGLHAAGTAQSARARVRQSDSSSLSLDIDARLQDAKVRFDSFPYEVTGIAGPLRISPQKVVLDNLVGRHGEAEIAFRGAVLLGGRDLGVDLNVDARNVKLDEAVRDALPAEPRRFWNDFSPSGTADMNFTYRRNLPDCPDSDYRFVLTGRGMQVRYTDFPYTFRGVTGSVAATPGKIEFLDVTAAEGPMKTVLRGTAVDDGKRVHAELAVSAKNVPIEPEFLAAMPGELAPLAKRVRPGGLFSAELSRVRFDRVLPLSTTSPSPGTPQSRPVDAAGRIVWDAHGDISCADATMDLGFGQRTISGKITGTAARTAEGLTLDADASLEKVSVAQAQITDLSARLHKSPRGAILVRDILARMHGGRISGFAEIRLSDPLRYGMSLSMEGVRLEELFPSTKPKTPAVFRGRLSGTIQYMATVGAGESQQASGVLRIAQADIRQLPVPMEMMQFMFLTLPGGSSFTDGDVIYRLRGQKLTFEEIALRGAALSLVGSGTMDMRTEAIHLTFLTGPPGKMPRLASLGDDLLSSIVREIAVIQINGTLSRPSQPRTVALQSLDAAIRQLLNPGAEPPPGQ
jgi:hypothetical protein